MLCILENRLHSKIFKNIILIFKDKSYREYKIYVNFKEKYEPFAHDSRLPRNPVPQLEDAKMPKDMTSGPIHTDLHLFL